MDSRKSERVVSKRKSHWNGWFSFFAAVFTGRDYEITGASRGIFRSWPSVVSIRAVVVSVTADAFLFWPMNVLISQRLLPKSLRFLTLAALFLQIGCCYCHLSVGPVTAIKEGLQMNYCYVSLNRLLRPLSFSIYHFRGTSLFSLLLWL